MSCEETWSRELSSNNSYVGLTCFILTPNKLEEAWDSVSRLSYSESSM